MENHAGDPPENPVEDSGRRKTTTRSFRVDEQALGTIERDAEDAQVSVNTFVNQLLRSYADFDRYFFKSTRNPPLSDTIGYTLGLLSDEAAAEAGRLVGTNVIRSFILSKYGSITLGSVQATIRLFAEYGKAYSLYETEEAGRRTMTALHSWGKKGSIYLAQAFASVFDVIDLKPKMTTSDKAVTLSL